MAWVFICTVQSMINEITKCLGVSMSAYSYHFNGSMAACLNSPLYQLDELPLLSSPPREALLAELKCAGPVNKPKVLP